ncbi:NAD/NADP octopine/nopaline dehydrogenase family protein [Streptococcus iners]|uniref:NAD/NADP octopine/nopaline dehydrogenase family protein n=1 Tax=Streptococcus iners subsp. hyiners TaxID=3028083 RepID=A0AA96VGZ6_9STRE|nr:NAD/NADP-dependent octopine/nopaline dehydrogenase family protein [Streptococcus sp. 29892]MCK4030130.1 NAD/NADP octopine/nopaline dehydrogenase [Streptococcus suis]WNY48837.1 NAD/NADP octopine/nopaline dehydrogenase family protein [Streptococcus sp. 29892]
MSVEEWKQAPIAILGAGAVGKAVGADSKLAGNRVHLFELPAFAEQTLKNLDKTGITLTGGQNSLYGFERSGRAFFDLVTDRIEEAVAGAKIIIVAVPSIAHDQFFEALVPVLEDGMIVHIIPDNFGSLKLRKKMRELGCQKQVIVGGWTSAPYGARIVREGGVMTPKIELKYRAITLRGAALPMTDQELFLESSRAIGAFDAITEGDGVTGGQTVLDVGFSNVNPVLHCPGTILGASVMENFGRIFGGNDPLQYSIYSHAYSESVAEVQYAFYLEQVQLAEAIGVDLLRYPKENFLSRTSILGPEYMGDDCIVPFDKQFPMAYGTGPFTIQDRYVTEDVPVGCHIYHELGKKYGVATPVIDSMIVLGSVMTGRKFFEEGLTLEDLDLAHLTKEETLEYLETGLFREREV